MSSQALPLLHRWLTLLFATLLALGPFLHSHFGASHETGFHLDGVHAVHSQAPSTMTVLQATDEDSPALGVAASLPHPEDDGWSSLGLALLIAVLPLLPLLRQALPHPRRVQQHRPATRYRAGLPPPCLAPPTH